MSLCPPRRNDSTLTPRHFGVDHRYLDTVYDANGVDPDLAILISIIRPLKRRPIEDPGCIFERNSVTGNVAPVFCRIPGDLMAPYLHYVLTPRDRADTKASLATLGPLKRARITTILVLG
jgi:hypothetical protein